MKNMTTINQGNYSGNIRSLWLRALCALLLLTTIFNLRQTVTAQTPEDFGYGRLKINGKEALGARPLLVLLAEHTELSKLAHSRDYYDNLIFNYFATDDNGQPINNLNGYFLVNSNGRFYWSRAGAGTLGPFNFTGADLTDKSQQPRQALAIQAAADAGFNFAEYDDNGDGHITNDELCVLVIENVSTDGAANRRSEPGCVRPAGSTVDVCLSFALAGHQASLMSMAHELSHSLGTIDLYGADGNQNYQYTLMGSTIYQRPDVLETFQLDPWHKLQFGWVEPKIYSIDTPGTDILGAAELVEGDQPIILYSPARGFNEYYLLEYRTNNRPEGAGYDANVPGSGLVIWHVKTDDNKVPVILPSLTKPGGSDSAVFINGAPNFSRGTGAPWPSSGGILSTASSGVVPYALKWLDGLGGNMKVKVGSTLDNGDRLRIYWDNYNTSGPLMISRKILYYNANNGAGAVGAINAQNEHLTLTSYEPGAFGQWTHIVGESSELFYYNAQTGAAALGYVDAGGNHHTTLSIRAGYFGTGWTHIVLHKGYLFFYCAGNGLAAIGQMSQNGFRQYASYPAGSFGLGWTSILSTKNGLVFYRATDGVGAVGEWEYVYSGAPGQFATISGVRFKQLRGYAPGSFTTGWSHIVETSNGVLFYRAADGLQVMTDVGANGVITTRSNTVKTLRAGWTHIVSVNDDILFYAAASGDAAVGEIQKYSPWVVPSAVGKLFIRREFPSYFSPGWTHLATTVDPTVVR
jgi:M6 family metalloprotease-like protein